MLESDELYMFCPWQYDEVSGSCRHSTDGTNMSDQLRSMDAVKDCGGVPRDIEVV